MSQYILGPLKVSPSQRVVLRGTEIIDLAPKTFNLLLLLIESPGEVVSRDTLRQAIWGDAFIEEAVISRNISLLRSKLRPYLGDTEIIETIPKRGYRLNVVVKEEFIESESRSAPDIALPNARTHRQTPAPEPLVTAAPPQPNDAAPFTGRPNHSRLMLWSFCLALVGIAAVAIFLLTAPSTESFPTGSWRAEPLTPGHDLEFEPATTPDGKQLAYVSRTSLASPFQIFLRNVDADPSIIRVLDTGPGNALYPAWSPDAKIIALLRCGTGPCEIATVPATGGPVKAIKTLPLYTLPDDQAYYQFRQLGPVWTRDGRSLIYPYRAPGDPAERLVQQDLASGSVRQLTFGQQGDDDGAPAISTDGKRVAFLRRQLNHTDIMVLDLKSGSTRVLETELNHTPSGVTWAHDDSGVVVGVIRPKVNSTLLWVPLRGPSRLLDISLPGMLNPVFTGDGKSLMVLSANRNRNLVQVTDSGDAPTPVFFTKQRNSFSSLSPDGRRLAFLSSVSGTFEVWLSERKGSLFSPPRQITNNLPYYPVSIAWSPDGSTLAIGISHTNKVEMVDVATGAFQPLQVPGLEKSNVWSPAWSADGRSVFLAVQGERNGIFRASATLVASVQELMRGDAQEVRLDAGRAVYFTSGNTNGIYKLKLQEGSSATLVPALAGVNPARDWSITAGKLFYLDLHDASRRLHCYDLETGQISDLPGTLIRPAFLDGSLSYAAKEHLLLYSEWSEEAGSQIFLLHPSQQTLPTASHSGSH